MPDEKIDKDEFNDATQVGTLQESADFLLKRAQQNLEMYKGKYESLSKKELWKTRVLLGIGSMSALFSSTAIAIPEDLHLPAFPVSVKDSFLIVSAGGSAFTTFATGRLLNGVSKENSLNFRRAYRELQREVREFESRTGEYAATLEEDGNTFKSVSRAHVNRFSKRISEIEVSLDEAFEEAHKSQISNDNGNAPAAE